MSRYNPNAKRYNILALSIAIDSSDFVRKVKSSSDSFEPGKKISLKDSSFFEFFSLKGENEDFFKNKLNEFESKPSEIVYETTRIACSKNTAFFTLQFSVHDRNNHTECSNSVNNFSYNFNHSKKIRLMFIEFLEKHEVDKDKVYFYSPFTNHIKKVNCSNFFDAEDGIFTHYKNTLPFVFFNINKFDESVVEEFKAINQNINNDETDSNKEKLEQFMKILSCHASGYGLSVKDINKKQCISSLSKETFAFFYQYGIITSLCGNGNINESICYFILAIQKLIEIRHEKNRQEELSKKNIENDSKEPNTYIENLNSQKSEISSYTNYANNILNQFEAEKVSIDINRPKVLCLNYLSAFGYKKEIADMEHIGKRIKNKIQEEEKRIQEEEKRIQEEEERRKKRNEEIINVVAIFAIISAFKDGSDLFYSFLNNFIKYDFMDNVISFSELCMPFACFFTIIIILNRLIKRKTSITLKIFECFLVAIFLLLTYLRFFCT